jgi:hypothetical protein
MAAVLAAPVAIAEALKIKVAEPEEPELWGIALYDRDREIYRFVLGDATRVRASVRMSREFVEDSNWPPLDDDQDHLSLMVEAVRRGKYARWAPPPSNVCCMGEQLTAEMIPGMKTYPIPLWRPKA